MSTFWSNNKNQIQYFSAYWSNVEKWSIKMLIWGETLLPCCLNTPLLVACLWMSTCSTHLFVLASMSHRPPLSLADRHQMDLPSPGPSQQPSPKATSHPAPVFIFTPQFFVYICCCSWNVLCRSDLTTEQYELSALCVCVSVHTVFEAVNYLL